MFPRATVKFNHALCITEHNHDNDIELIWVQFLHFCPLTALKVVKMLPLEQKGRCQTSVIKMDSTVFLYVYYQMQASPKCFSIFKVCYDIFCLRKPKEYLHQQYYSIICIECTAIYYIKLPSSTEVLIATNITEVLKVTNIMIQKH